jgi:hypothetical protein
MGPHSHFRKVGSRSQAPHGGNGAGVTARADRRDVAVAILDPAIRAQLVELATREHGYRLTVHEREAILECQGDFASAEMSQRAGAWVELLARVAEACEREASS